jgi:hypothetical protein
MSHSGFATTGYEKAHARDTREADWISEAGNRLENTNPIVNVVRALAGHNEE